MEAFKALLVTRDEATKKQSVGVAALTPADLMPGDVDVRVEYSTINYKDGLAITGKLPVVRRWPMIPGIDFAGTVAASSNPAFKPGDKVVLNGWGLGETHLGAYSDGRVNYPLGTLVGRFGETAATVLFPSNPIARESIARYVDALKSVCARVADGRYTEPLSRLAEVPQTA